MVVKHPLKAYEPKKISAFGKYKTTTVKQSMTVALVKQSMYLYHQGTVFGTWIFGGFWCALPLFTPHPYVTHGFKTSCTFGYYTQNSTTASAIIITTFTFGFALPLAITMVFYVLIFQHLREEKKKRETALVIRSLQASQLMTIPSNRLISSINRLKQVQKEIVDQGLVRSSCLTIFMFSLLWLPYAVMTFLAQYSPKRAELITPTSMAMITMIAKSSAVVNPIVYGLSNQKLIHQLLRIKHTRNMQFKLKKKDMHNYTA